MSNPKIIWVSRQETIEIMDLAVEASKRDRRLPNLYVAIKELRDKLRLETNDKLWKV